MRLTLKQIRKIVITIVLILLAGFSGWWLRGEDYFLQDNKLQQQKVEIVNRDTPVDKKIDFSLFWDVWDKTEEKFLEKEKIDSQKMFYGAIQGMVASLEDPYTVFLPPKENKKTKEDLNGSFEGVGIRLGFDDQRRLMVIAPLKGMPAEAAGVKAGDLILHIKDENKGIDEGTNGISLPEAVEKIRGPKGTKITLTLVHENSTEPFQANIERGEIIVPSVKVDFLEEEVAHLQLMRFGDLTAKQWDQSVAEIQQRSGEIKGVVLDLRGNPGGYLKGSVNLASEFLSKGVIVKQEDYNGRVETYSVNRRGRLLEIPLVVLIDKGSASASEILAGALQDHQRAELVGVKSFGKGTIQESEELGRGAALHITTAKWLTPEGRWVNKEGLEPDVIIEDNQETEDIDEQLEKAVEVLKNN